MTEWFFALLKKCEKALDYMIEEVSLTTYVAALALVILGCGALYAFLTPESQGIAKGDLPLTSCTYLDGVYFSVVTLSSLGYGELHPIGWSRFIACSEVLFGLGWLGIVVAKITSRRLSYQVKRLFSSDVQRRLEEFIAKFEDAERLLRNLMDAVSATNAPGNGHREGEQARVMADLRKNISSLNTVSSAWASYISFESQHPGYFALVPVESLRRLQKTIDDVLVALGQLVRIVPPSSITNYLKSDDRRRIGEVLESQKTACSAIRQQSTDEELRKLAAEVEKTCVDFPQNYYAIPVATGAAAQPDQVPLGVNAPQEFIEPGM